MKKETARMIKTAAAGIVMLAAVICYNVEWKGSGDTAQFHLTALQEETAEAVSYTHLTLPTTPYV